MSTDPDDADADISASVAPQVVFDEALDPTTVTSSSVQLLDSDDISVTASVTLANGNTTVVITPSSPLGYLVDYHIAVTSDVTDMAGNAFAGTLNEATFTTEDVPPDTTAPVVTDIHSTAITATSVTITWTTNENSDSQVEYGTTSAYGTSNTLDAAPVTSHSMTVAGLSADTVYHFRVHSADAATNAAASADNVFQTTIDDSSAVLAVTGIDAVDTFAAADNTFENGWSWIFHVTVPTSETDFAMKFADFVSGANTILVASNIRYFTAQASAADDEASAVTILGTEAYPASIILDGDADLSAAGRQINVTVEMRVPTGSAGGSYSSSYGVASN